MTMLLREETYSRPRKTWAIIYAIGLAWAGFATGVAFESRQWGRVFFDVVMTVLWGYWLICELDTLRYRRLDILDAKEVHDPTEGEQAER